MKLPFNLKTAAFFLWPILVLAGIGVFRMLETEKYGAGKVLYLKHCASCHMEDGTGLRAIIPPLAKADFVQNHGADMACMIRYGMAEEIVVNGQSYQRPMYGQPNIKEVEIRNIINYIKNAWGNTGPEISFAEIKNALEACSDSETVPPP